MVSPLSKPSKEVSPTFQPYFVRMFRVKLKPTALTDDLLCVICRTLPSPSSQSPFRSTDESCADAQVLPGISIISQTTNAGKLEHCLTGLRIISAPPRNS